jgi:hypothetical protein
MGHVCAGSLSFHPALFPYLNYNRAPSALSRLCPSFVFSRLRTLSFFIPPLSPAATIACALFPKKPGVHPPAWSYQVSSVSGKGGRLMANGFLLTSFFPLHTKIPLVSPFLPLHAQKPGGVPPQKCRRADIFDFFPDFSHFFPSAPQHRLHPALREEQKSWHKSQRYIQECRRRTDPPYAKSVKLLIDILNRWGILGCCKAQSLIWREHLSGEAACFAIGGGIGLAKRAWESESGDRHGFSAVRCGCLLLFPAICFLTLSK